MAELTHDFTVAYPTLQRSIKNVQAPLDAALKANDISTIHQYIQSVSRQIVDLKALVRLTQNMLGWFFDLADDSERKVENAGVDAGHDEQEVIKVSDILRDIEEPISKLANLKNRHITWPDSESYLAVSVPVDTTNLIAAVLFKFLDNAIKKTVKDDITVTCVPGHMENNIPGVVFQVTNSGQPISALDQPLLFKLRYRPGSAHGSASTGIGLYQAQLIARRLGGIVGYDTDEVDHNIFWLALPRVETIAE